MSDFNQKNKRNPFEDAVNFVRSTNDYTQEYDQYDIQRNKVIAAIGYLPFFFFLPLVACPRSRFGRFHANQSLVLFIVSMIGSVVLSGLSAIFSLGLVPLAVIFKVISDIWGLAIVLMVVLGVVNTMNEKAKELPLIGQWRILN